MKPFWGIISLLVLVHIMLLAFPAWRDSPTLDEVAHLPSGILHLTTGDTSLYCVNPPLVRLTASVPVVLLKPELDWRGLGPVRLSRMEFDVGRRFCELNQGRTTVLYGVGRLACLPFSVLVWYLLHCGVVENSVYALLLCPQSCGRFRLVSWDTDILLHRTSRRLRLEWALPTASHDGLTGHHGDERFYWPVALA